MTSDTPIALCDSLHCDVYTLRFCRICQRRLCVKHDLAADHECPREGEDEYYPAFRTSLADAVASLLARLDINRLRSIISKARPHVHLEEIDLSKPSGLPMGGLNLHLPISFSDGVQWLARLPQSSPTSPPQVILDKSLLSETATYSLLQSVGVKVPRIHALEVGGSTPSFFLMDRLPGTPKFYEILSDPAARRRVIEDVADCFIAISTLPLAACGAPTFDTQGTVTIGPLVEPRWHQRAQDGSLKMLGPYKSAREKHIACIEVVLDRIKGGFQHVEDAEEVYLIHLELIEIVKLLYPTGSATSFFLRHTDAKGDNWLIDESNHISGFIDWEWAEAASPHEAFAAPEAFFDVGAFYEGVNDLSYREQDLADALDRKSRSDLAAYVRNGKAYQRLPFLIGGSVDVDYFRMYQSLRSIVLGRVMERGEWLTMAREKFGADGGWKNLKG